MIESLVLPRTGDYSVGGPFRPYCAGCPLAHDGNFARNDGRGWTGVLALAESLGKDEVIEHRPLVGWTGEYFDKLVGKIKYKTPLDRNAFLLANTINCQPPGNKLSKQRYEHEALFKCRPYLEETLAEFKPKAILAMGGVAFRALTGHTGLLGRPGWRGYVVPSPYGPVIPTFHPAFILRGKIGYSWFWLRDAAKALKVADGEWTVSPVNYQLRPTVAEAWAYYERAKQEAEVLANDIETNWSPGADEDEEEYFERPLEETASYQIARISFSHRENTAISFAWEGEYIEVAKALLQLPVPKLYWNAPFDVPREEASGAKVAGRIYDVMLAWKAWQPQLRWSLAHAASALTDMPPWKHEAWDQPEWYSCCDSDAPVRIFNILRPIMEKSGQWEAYERHFVDLQQVLSVLSRRGVPTDRALRAETRADLKGQFEGVTKELTPMVPEEVRPVYPREGYKSNEEHLRKLGTWVEGEMTQIQVEISDDELEARQRKQSERAAKASAKEAKSATAGKKPRKARRRAEPDAGGGRDRLPGAEDGSADLKQIPGRPPRRRATSRKRGRGSQPDNSPVPGGGDPGDGPPARVAIVGSRGYKHLERVDAYVDSLPAGTIVVSGGADGVDKRAVAAAKKRGLGYDEILPVGSTPRAKFARNTKIVQNSSRVVAFWNGTSNGTEDTILKAKAFGKPVEIILEED